MSDLFNDINEDEDIFSTKPVRVKVDESKKPNKKDLLFDDDGDDDDDGLLLPLPPAEIKPVDANPDQDLLINVEEPISSKDQYKPQSPLFDDEPVQLTDKDKPQSPLFDDEPPAPSIDIPKDQANSDEDIFSKVNSQSQMSFFSPASKESFNFSDTIITADVPPLPLDDFELIDVKDVPSAEEAERNEREIHERLEKEKKEKELREKEEETVDGGIFSKSSRADSNTKEMDQMPLSMSPPLTSSTEESTIHDEDNNSKQFQAQIQKLEMRLMQVQSENSSLKSEIEELRELLDEEISKNKKLEKQIEEKNSEIDSLKAKPKPTTSKPPLTQKTSGSNLTKAAPSSHKTEAKSSARLNAENRKTASVADNIKRFTPSAGSQSPKQERISVSSRPTKTAPSGIKRDQSSTTTSTTAKKDRTSSTSSQEGSSTALSKKDQAEISSTTKNQEPLKKSPPKPQRQRVAPSESPQMNQSRSALDAIKAWEQKTSSVSKQDTHVTPVKKQPLSVQQSTPILVSSGDDTPSSTSESQVEISTEENKPPVPSIETSTDEEAPVPLRQKPVDKEKRDFKSHSAIEPGMSSVPKGRKWGPILEKCETCNKTVYQQERLQADGKVWHKHCFRCTHCKKVVGLGNYATNKGDIYCKVHFKMLFKIKGNYDEGFGRSQHKTKWANKSDGDQSEPVSTLTQ